jgi:mRNA interferase MazF
VRRGDVVRIVFDKEPARPAVVVQADLFEDGHPSVTLAPITSTIVAAPLFRITVEPDAGNGLTAVSQVMIDKLTTVHRDKMGAPVGSLDEASMVKVSRALALWTGLGS